MKKFIFHSKYLIFCEFILILLWAFVWTSFIATFQGVTDNAIAHNWKGLIELFIIEIIYVILMFMISPIKDFLIQKIIFKTLNNLRLTISNKMNELSFEEFQKNKHFINLYIYDSSYYIKSFLNSFFKILELVFNIIFIVINLFILNLYIGIFGFFIVFLVYMSTLIGKKNIANKNKEISNIRKKNINSLNDTLSSFKRAYLLDETDILLELNKNNVQEMQTKTKKYNNALNLRDSLINLFSGISYTAFYLIMGFLILFQNSSIGLFIAAVTFLNNIFANSRPLSQEIFVIKSFNKIKDRIMYFITKDQSIEKKLSNIEQISAQNLTINFGKNEIFSDLSFSINKNEKVLILGESGKGKSTLLKIIMGTIDSHDGFIKWNDSLYKFANIQKFMSHTNNLPIVFSGSIDENITLFSNNIDKSKLENAKKIANINFEVENCENLSLGQKQRIEIASAYYFSSNLIVFDETFSNLDSQNVQTILQNISKLNNHTIIVVSHNLTKKQIALFDKTIDLNSL